MRTTTVVVVVVRTPHIELKKHRTPAHSSAHGTSPRNTDQSSKNCTIYIGSAEAMLWAKWEFPRKLED